MVSVHLTSTIVLDQALDSYCLRLHNDIDDYGGIVKLLTPDIKQFPHLTNDINDPPKYYFKSYAGIKKCS